tara:strand:- start:3568 stop:4080 length:513 start_codon:yes stop_codon:yes gene_type:complete
MEITTLIANIVLSMMEYQKENQIENRCVTNVQYLYDIMKKCSIINFKTKAVIVVSSDEDTKTLQIVSGHLIIEVDDATIIDPSYDISCLKNKTYVDSIKVLLDLFTNPAELKTVFDMKKIVTDYTKFINLSEQLNNGERICANEHYDKQANYIENLYSNISIIKELRQPP